MSVIPANCFNPLPTRRPGERSIAVGFRRIIGVSIRSRPEGRGGAWIAGITVTPQTFQSAPDPKAGREHDRPADCPRHVMFQSAPSPKAGREDQFSEAVPPVLVSIRSRPEGRERAQSSYPATTHVRLFQSAPGPKAGRKVAATNVASALSVSIRSRPEGRERAGATGTRA